MTKKKITKQDVLAALKKMQEDQRLVMCYLKGEITKVELEKHGIKLAKPI